MKYLMLVLCGLSLSGCATIAGIASDVNAITNPPSSYYYGGPPGHYYRGCQWRNGRRWC